MNPFCKHVGAVLALMASLFGTFVWLTNVTTGALLAGLFPVLVVVWGVLLYAIDRRFRTSRAG